MFELTIFVENFVPYNYLDDQNQLTGPSADQGKQLILLTGTNVDIKTSIPWSRCIQAIEQGIFLGKEIETPVAVFSMMRIPPREKKYKWVGPLTPFEMGFYIFDPSIQIPFPEKESNQNKDSLEKNLEYFKVNGFIIGTSGKESAGHKLLIEKKFPEAQLFEMTIPSSGPLMLARGRIDILLSDRAAGYSYAKQNVIDINKMKWVCTLIKRDLYIAFSLNTPDALIEKWQTVLDDMTEERKKILIKYGLD